MATFSLGKHPHVELCDLLKLEGWSESGAQAKNRHCRRVGEG
ncbi:ribosome-associated protein [Salmonella enterica subsp. enterica]|nr:ribosome-associated protein [Salmonella enterica subsp. enterica]